ncbi:MAG: D-alanyl-D-alanine carboxypeptidase [Okeania sp. SIO2C2]|uniref:peptidoglycan-binding protein n=1 Tax=Okeania sp. SIO2C2 TaxID=2607787 RepID=UPI0013BB64CE|nr:peptidoglycan-binding protein [Okeania sp. SIO2C2]NEP87329.1 D-alanyl-D-alanine carboxypeptidase [Okeania sp. SIO2C2]
MNNVVPGTLVDFSDLNISINSRQFPLLQPAAKNALRRAIQNRGTTMGINSGYRTCAQQYLLRRWFEYGNPCGFQAVAQPGSSSHESGLALDLADWGGWRPYLETQGWVWYGWGDVVHFSFPGIPIGNIEIKAFQTLWNRNHLNDQIDADGLYGLETASKLSISPSEGFGGDPGLRILRLASPFMRGGDVRRVQKKLKEGGYLNNDSDVEGIYGPITEAAVRKFQTNEGITVDGVVGPDTYRKLGI